MDVRLTDRDQTLTIIEAGSTVKASVLSEWGERVVYRAGSVVFKLDYVGEQALREASIWATVRNTEDEKYFVPVLWAKLVVIANRPVMCTAHPYLEIAPSSPPLSAYRLVMNISKRYGLHDLLIVPYSDNDTDKAREWLDRNWAYINGSPLIYDYGA